MAELDETALLPCPHCGERLVLKGDHHGEWWGHRNDVGSCIHSVTQLMDEEDFAAWNRRSHQSAEPATVSVKALEWPLECRKGRRVTGTAMDGDIEYGIVHHGDSNGENYIYQWAARARRWSPPFSTYEAAQAAAQTDFDSRIRASLSISSAGPIEHLRHDCAKSGHHHEHDGCSCTDAELLLRALPPPSSTGERGK